MRFRIAISTGLAAAVILSVFVLIRLDSQATGNGEDITTTGFVVEVAPGEILVEQEVNPQEASVRQASADLDALPGSASQILIPDPVYVYPDGSPAPPPSIALSSRSAVAENERDHDDDDDEHEYWHDDDHDEHERDHDDYDDDEREHGDDHDEREFNWEKLARGLIGNDDEHDDDDHDDD